MRYCIGRCPGTQQYTEGAAAAPDGRCCRVWLSATEQCVPTAGQEGLQGGQQRENKGEQAPAPAARMSSLDLQQHKEDLREAQQGQRVRAWFP